MTSFIRQYTVRVAVVTRLVVGSLVAASAASSADTTTTSTTTLTVTGTASGETSPAIIAENQLPGSADWRIPRGASTTAIMGFANVTYASQGQSVTFYVDAHVPQYTITAYRMGWYQGLGGRKIWASNALPGQHQPACPVDKSTNTVSCANWSPSLTVPITTDFVSGDYLFKLSDGNAAASYVQLTVWDPTSTAAYVVMNRSFAEQGWNTYGGYSFYSGTGNCIIDTISYPPCNRARAVSFDRPYDSGAGASDFLPNEYPLVQYMEKRGLNVTYITDFTLDEHPSLLLNHHALLSLDHDETWTYAERMAVVDAQKHGVNVVYFGAAAMVRHARLEPSSLGPDRVEVDYRNNGEDPLNGTGASGMQITANTWADPPTNWSPVSQIGVNYSGYLAPNVFAPMTITDAGAWVYAGTGLKNGDTLPGVIGSDIDHVISTSVTPKNLEILAHSPISTSTGTFSGETWGGKSYSDMVYFTDPHSMAGVIDTGNNIWIGQLRPCKKTQPGCPAPILQTITGNILRVFGAGPAGLGQSPHPNRDVTLPAGS
jgi:hypothetical protein